MHAAITSLTKIVAIGMHAQLTIERIARIKPICRALAGTLEVALQTGAAVRAGRTQKADVTPARAASMAVAANSQVPTGVMRVKNGLAQTADTVPTTTKRASATSVPRRPR